jgi:hypothetical protein
MTVTIPRKIAVISAIEDAYPTSIFLQLGQMHITGKTKPGKQLAFVEILLPRGKTTDGENKITYSR